MDHKLAIVIVPSEARSPVEASAAMLHRFQHPSAAQPRKLRYKQVGGWFDGLVNGAVGQERWSSILRLMFRDSPLEENGASPICEFGPETILSISNQIETDNTIDPYNIWSHAPVSIVVSPSGEWFSHSTPDSLEDPASYASDSLEDRAWGIQRQKLFEQYRGFRAVAWDVSWHFIGIPPEIAGATRSRMPRAWGLKRSKVTPTSSG